MSVFKMADYTTAKTFVKPYKQAIFVTTAGFEPARPCEHQPLKLASLPFLHVA